MPYTKNLDFRNVSHSRMPARLKQVLVLMLAVVIGLLLSVSVNAQGPVKDNTAFHPKNIEHTLTP
jgi:hypothetical protein